MKKEIILSLAMLAGAAQANECTLVVPQQPGGAHDIYARLMQKINPDIKIEYKPGAYAVSASNYVAENPSVALLSLPNMYSTKSPLAEPQIDMMKIILSVDQIILTNKGVTVDDLMTKKLNVGIPFYGAPAHHIAEQLKRNNPSLTLVPLDGDAKALPLLKNGEVDVYVTATPNGRKWVNSFGFNSLVEVPTGKETKFGSVNLINVSIIGIYSSKKATNEQKANILKCVDRAVNTEDWVKLTAENNIRPTVLDGAKKDQALKTYIEHQKQYGL